MAKFRATINTERGKEVSKLGNKEISTHTCGWNAGVRVDIIGDEISIHKTGGSNNSSNIGLIQTIKIKE